MTEAVHHLGRDVGLAVAKTLPPVTMYTLTLNEWVAVATILYIMLQAAHLIWKWGRDMRSRAADKAAINMLMGGRIAKVGEAAPEDA